MKKPRYTDQQIAQALRQAEQGLPVAELCRKLGVSETTFYHRKKRYAGMGVAEQQHPRAPGHARQPRSLALKRGRVPRNPVDLLTRPRRKTRLPRVPRWKVVERLLVESKRPRDRALIALMCFGGLRRSEIVALDIGDVAPDFGLRRVRGKGGYEAAVPLPMVARSILAEYVIRERAEANGIEPLFGSRYKTKGSQWVAGRMKDHRVWKIVRAIGERTGIPELHPQHSVIRAASSYCGAAAGICGGCRSISVYPSHGIDAEGAGGIPLDR